MRQRIQKNDAITVAAARSQLKLLLANARSLDNLTPEILVRSYRVPLREIEYELVMERQRREARG
ncbi:hypothetical protein SAMN02927924_01416 [Sphingobium faniae]|nr:hypothetical protein SAMN02927924_01416 [Sphingobium faniae]